MARIKVSLLNFHGIFSHIEILLENLSSEESSYYSINRWDTPAASFLKPEKLFPDHSGETFERERQHYLRRVQYFKTILSSASSIYTFEIEADPDDIAQKWRDYHQKTLPDEGILRHNCAVSAQWFLREFAHVPDPKAFSGPVSLNHLALGIPLPSFMPIGITLPGRIMDNAKFHINARLNPPSVSNLVLSLSIALATVVIVGSIVGIIAASLFMTGGLGALVIAGCAVTGAVSLGGLFKATNTLAAKRLASDDASGLIMPAGLAV